MSSSYTKASRAKLWLYRILDWVCLSTPMIVYIIMALFGDGVTSGGKVAIVGTVIVAVIFTLFNIIFQKRIRCSIWILLIGVYIAMKDFLLPLVLILAGTSILDDFIFTPLIQHYKAELIANKTMDSRERSYGRREEEQKEE